MCLPSPDIPSAPAQTAPTIEYKTPEITMPEMPAMPEYPEITPPSPAPPAPNPGADTISTPKKDEGPGRTAGRGLPGSKNSKLKGTQALRIDLAVPGNDGGGGTSSLNIPKG